jgi:hypothetical protein
MVRVQPSSTRVAGCAYLFSGAVTEDDPKGDIELLQFRPQRYSVRLPQLRLYL